MPFFGFGETEYEKRIRITSKRARQQVHRVEEARRRVKAEEKEEEKRRKEIESLGKRRETLIARAREREALARKRRAEREARGERVFGRRLPSLPKVSKRTKRAGIKAVTRGRRRESKISWL